MLGRCPLGFRGRRRGEHGSRRGSRRNRRICVHELPEIHRDRPSPGPLSLYPSSTFSQPTTRSNSVDVLCNLQLPILRSRSRPCRRHEDSGTRTEVGRRRTRGGSGTRKGDNKSISLIRSVGSPVASVGPRRLARRHLLGHRRRHERRTDGVGRSARKQSTRFDRQESNTFVRQCRELLRAGCGQLFGFVRFS